MDMELKVPLGEKALEQFQKIAQQLRLSVEEVVVEVINSRLEEAVAFDVKLAYEVRFVELDSSFPVPALERNLCTSNSPEESGTGGSTAYSEWQPPQKERAQKKKEVATSAKYNQPFPLY